MPEDKSSGALAVVLAVVLRGKKREEAEAKNNSFIAQRRCTARTLLQEASKHGRLDKALEAIGHSLDKGARLDSFASSGSGKKGDEICISSDSAGVNLQLVIKLE